MFPVIETRDAFQKASERLLVALREQGMDATPNQALNLLSRVYEAKDWNVVSAALKAREKAALPVISSRSLLKPSAHTPFKRMDFPSPVTHEAWDEFLMHAYDNGIYRIMISTGKYAVTSADLTDNFHLTERVISSEDIKDIYKHMRGKISEAYAEAYFHYDIKKNDKINQEYEFSLRSSLNGLGMLTLEIKAYNINALSINDLVMRHDDIVIQSFTNTNHGINIIAGGSFSDRQRLLSGLIRHTCENSKDYIKFVRYGDDHMYGFSKFNFEHACIYDKNYSDKDASDGRFLLKNLRSNVNHIALAMHDSTPKSTHKNMILNYVIPVAESGVQVSMCLRARTLAGGLINAVDLYDGPHSERERETSAKRFLSLVNMIVFYKEIYLPLGSRGVVRECLVFDDNVRHMLRRSPTHLWYAIINEMLLSGRADSQPIQAYSADPLHADFLPHAGVYPESQKSSC